MLKLDLWKLLLDLKSIASDILRYIFEPAEWIQYIAIYFNLPSEYDTWPADKPPIYLQKSFISNIYASTNTHQQLVEIFTRPRFWSSHPFYSINSIQDHAMPLHQRSVIPVRKTVIFNRRSFISLNMNVALVETMCGAKLDPESWSAKLP